MEVGVGEVSCGGRGGARRDMARRDQFWQGGHGMVRFGRVWQGGSGSVG